VAASDGGAAERKKKGLEAIGFLWCGDGKAKGLQMMMRVLEVVR
jgi:hypothetical protein